MELKDLFRRVALVVLALVCWQQVCALIFPKGEFYFDNGKQRYARVKLIAGSLAQKWCRVIDLQPVPRTNLWKAVFTEPCGNVDFYAFANSELPAGDYPQRVGSLLDSLSRNEPGFKRTYTLKTIYPSMGAEMWVFCPIFDLPYSEGYWRPLSSYQAAPSGTLPVVYITTQDSMSISTREYYISASLWMDSDEASIHESIGCEVSQLPIDVKGRGNWTWNNSYKKPYRLKFATKQSPMGLESSRHFVLLAHNEDISGYLRNTTGFEVSRLMGMPYTPREVPVELVINGDYEGLYFLCEKIRVESGRVDIFEQADLEQDPDNITGGWLLQLSDKGTPVVISQHQGNNPANPTFTIISESPEELSSAQQGYIHNLLHSADSCIYLLNKNDRGWEQLLDMTSVARFYIIHEVMENVEAFSGSLYMYKDLGAGEKLHFGPVWDFDNSYFQDATTADHFIFDYGTPYPFLWIKELVKFPRFMQEVKTQWRQFMSRDPILALRKNATEWRATIAVAEQHDRQRWPFYASSHAQEKPSEYMNVIAGKITWLNTQWNSHNDADVNCDGVVNVADVIALFNYIFGGDTTHLATSDVNGDGAVNVGDVIAVRQVIFGH